MKVDINDKLFNEEELKNTPKRVKKFIETEWAEPVINFTTFPNKGYDQMIILKDIEFESLCSHHLLPFFGNVHIGYIPKELLCGLSKLARVVDYVAHNPSMQENLTQKLINYLVKQLQPEGVMVVITAEHTCMTCRGPKKKQARMITSAINGAFKKKEPREEFLALIKNKE